MQMGLMPGGLHTAGELGALAAEAEALGFDSLWAGDHIEFPAPILDPFGVLACYAAHTRRVRLGTCVYLLALRHPTPVAKALASLDFVTEGRLIFGIGVGGEFPREFRACEVPMHERGPRTDEAIRVLRRLWRGEAAAQEGRFFRIGPVRLAPPPAQAGGPPIWVGGRSDAALRRAAYLGDGYVGYLLGADGFCQRMARIRELAGAAGNGGRGITAALMTFALVDPRRETARKRAGELLSAMYARPMASVVGRYCVAGTPAECREAVQRYAEAGVEHLILTPLAWGERTLDQIRMLADALRVQPES